MSHVTGPCATAVSAVADPLRLGKLTQSWDPNSFSARVSHDRRGSPDLPIFRP
jgi:hypothetical protein